MNTKHKPIPKCTSKTQKIGTVPLTYSDKQLTDEQIDRIWAKGPNLINVKLIDSFDMLIERHNRDEKIAKEKVILHKATPQVAAKQSCDRSRL